MGLRMKRSPRLWVTLSESINCMVAWPISALCGVGLHASLLFVCFHPHVRNHSSEERDSTEVACRQKLVGRVKAVPRRRRSKHFVPKGVSYAYLSRFSLILDAKAESGSLQRIHDFAWGCAAATVARTNGGNQTSIHATVTSKAVVTLSYSRFACRVGVDRSTGGTYVHTAGSTNVNTCGLYKDIQGNGGRWKSVPYLFLSSLVDGSGAHTLYASPDGS